MQVDSQGWVQGLGRRAPSPYFDRRPPSTTVDLLVIHNISLPPGVFGGPDIEALFCGTLDCSQHPAYADLRDVKVSSHFLIRRCGELVQFVSVLDRAWHAGASEFRGRSRCNDFSVGIELEGCDDQLFASAQYDTLGLLCRGLRHHNPKLAWIAGHSDIAPLRKTDPGPCFDWERALSLVRADGSRIERPFC